MTNCLEPLQHDVGYYDDSASMQVERQPLCPVEDVPCCQRIKETMDFGGPFDRCALSVRVWPRRRIEEA
jgi:hypothetical protein